GAQRRAGGLEERRVDDALVAAGHRAQLRRQREGDQEVGARQQAIELVLEPGPGLVLLATRAMPVAAGPAHGVGPATRGAGVEHGPPRPGAARRDRTEHLLVLPRAWWRQIARD